MSLKSLFAKPLIVGASVSADYATASPGKVLARRYGTDKALRMHAASGSAGLQVIETMPTSKLEGATIVIGVDLMFWDSTRPADCVRACHELDVFLARLRVHGTPIVIGNVPELLPGLQPCARDINAVIARNAEKDDSCRVLDLNGILREIRREGKLTVRGKSYSIAQLVPDGLHVNAFASEYLADRIERLYEVEAHASKREPRAALT